MKIYTREYMNEVDYEQVLNYSPAQARADELASELYFVKKERDEAIVWATHYESLYRETLDKYISNL